jgi:hypothetical protein
VLPQIENGEHDNFKRQKVEALDVERAFANILIIGYHGYTNSHR